MKLQVQFLCQDCESYNQNRPIGYYEKDTLFWNLTQAVKHLREYPDHHVEAYIEDDRKLVEVDAMP